MLSTLLETGACELDGEKSTRALGLEIGHYLLPDGLLLLRGDMGSGKTVLTKGVAAALGIQEQAVQSPTFTLVNELPAAPGHGATVLVHVDLYRLEPEEVASAGILEALEMEHAVKVVEWAERFAQPPAGELELRLEAVSERVRRAVLLRARGC